MDDEQLPGEAGADTTTDASVDWEKRYRDTHANWNNLNEQMARFKNDPNAVIEFLQETHPDLLADEDEEEDTEDDNVFEDPRDQQIAALEARLQRLEPWQQDVEAERGERRFNNDLKAALGDQEITDRQRAWIKSRTFELGNNPDALKQAVEDFTELSKEIAGAHLDQVTKSKKAPHVAAGGQPGTQVPKLDTHEERRVFYRQRIAEKQSQQ